MPWTQSKYTDYIIFNYLESPNLLKLAQTNKQMAKLCLGEKYFEYRIHRYYGQAILDHKPATLTYRQQDIDIYTLLYVTGLKHDQQWKRFDLILVSSPDDILATKN